MKALNVLLVLGAVGGGYYYQTHRHEAAVVSTASSNGFVDVPAVQDAVPGRVMVIAAKHCSKEDAQRADALAKDLAAKGVAVDRTDKLAFTMDGDTSPDVAQNLQNIMNGPLPAVIVDGRGSSNPSLAEVLAEVKRDTP